MQRRFSADRHSTLANDEIEDSQGKPEPLGSLSHTLFRLEWCMSLSAWLHYYTALTADHYRSR